jgi:hypothetical protein
LEEEESSPSMCEEDWGHAIVEEESPSLHEEVPDEPIEEDGENRGPTTEKSINVVGSVRASATHW